MTLSSMVVSRDWQEVSVLECILGGLHIGVEVVPEPDRAWNKLTHSKVDAVIVDSDLAGADKFLRQLKQANHAPSVPLVIISAATHPRAKSAAHFTFEKPISVEQAVHTLSAARNLIVEGRLRYHRQLLNVPVSLTIGKKKVSAHLMNLSQGGMGIHLQTVPVTSGPIRIMFDLPGSDTPLKAEGQIAWTDDHGNAGIRFVKMSDRLRRGLQVWLEQRYFSH
jgi:hypothetical protein